MTCLTAMTQLDVMGIGMALLSVGLACISVACAGVSVWFAIKSWRSANQAERRHDPH